MNYNKFPSFQVLLTLFLVKFYINHIIIAPFVYDLYSKTSIIMLCIIYFLQPLELIFINKLFNNKYNPFITNKFFIFIYTLIFESLIIFGLASFLNSYIYSVSNISFLMTSILIPLLFINKYHYSNIIRLTPFFFLLTIGMLMFFFFTMNDITLFSIFPNKKIDNLFLFIIIVINITFPYILFPYFKDLSNSNFKLSSILILGIFFSLLNILLTLRQGISLGILITEKAFPLYEVLRFLSITTYSIPLDILFITFLFCYSFYVISVISAYILYIFNINKYMIKNIFSFFPFILAIFFSYNIELFEIIKYDLLVIGAFCLVYIVISTFISYLRRTKYEK